MSKSKTDLYKESGVDVEKGEQLVDWLQKEKAVEGKGGSVVSGIGGFAALFRPDFSNMKDPLLVSGTDGVGTKLLLGLKHDILKGLGIDLVAMCVNDLYTLGARPLFFLDYYATGKLNDKQFKEILTGIRQGLSLSSCALMGGETAELPGLYEKNHFDLAGFVVGVVDGEKVIKPEHVQAGDKLYAFEASGFHSNGYSLVRRWLDQMDHVSDELIDHIMTPTKIYSEVPELIEKLPERTISALSNITGGGISGNLPRVMPNNVTCSIEFDKIQTPTWMKDFIESNGSTVFDMEATFNIGCGMIAAIDPNHAAEFEKACADMNLKVYEIGAVKERQESPMEFIR